MICLRSPWLFVATSLLAGPACGGEDLTLPPGAQTTQIEAVQGDDQTGLPNSRLADPLIVRLLDEAGSGIPNRTVLWVIQEGGGTVSPATGMTDAEGFASAEWTLGPSPGANVVDAQVPDIGLVTFTSMASSDGSGSEPSASRSTISAEPSLIPAGTGASTIVVTVLDQSGDPVEGATVTLQATGENNDLAQPPDPTGADGVAVGVLRSATPGEKVISATVGASVPLAQTALVTVVAPGAARIGAVEGDGQSVPAGEPVPTRPAVMVVDQSGDPVAGVQVIFVVTGGGGSVADADQITGSDGIARVADWTLGPSAGTNTLEARAPSLEGSPVIFRAQATDIETAVDHLEFRLQPPAELEENESFRVEVALVDSLGNVVPLSEIFIYLGLFPEGSDVPVNDDLNGERFENTVNGIATFDLRVVREGRYRLRALTDDIPALVPHGPEPFLFSRVFNVR